MRTRAKVFISYRREGGAEMARLLRDELRNRRYEVFMDVEDLRSGLFNTNLFHQIESSTDVVVVLTPKSMERCSNENDWQRMEIAHALKCRKNVVPVKTRDFTWPSNPLPDELKDLPNLQAIEPSHDYFDASIDRLAKLLCGAPTTWFRRSAWPVILGATVLIVASVSLYLSNKFATETEPAMFTGDAHSSYEPEQVSPQQFSGREYHDLDDNRVPAGWTLQNNSAGGCCGGIQGGRLVAEEVDANYLLIKRASLPVGATMLRLEYDGNLNYSSNGMATSAEMICGSDTLVAVDGISCGDQRHLSRIWVNSPGVSGNLVHSKYYALAYDDFHYLVEFTQGKIHYKCTSISNGSVVFDLTVSDRRSNLPNVTGVRFTVYATTENDEWVDNISVEVEHI
jgi:TIR domain